MSSSVNMSLYPEPSSPSSVYLPPLLDSSPYPTTTGAANDRDSCSYVVSSSTPKEHVSCFSTFSVSAAANTAHNSLANGSFDLAPPPPPVAADPFARFQRNVGVSAFPSLRSLQDNLQLPFFFSPAAVHGGAGGDMNGLTVPEEQRVVEGGSGMALCPSELDYMWGY